MTGAWVWQRRVRLGGHDGSEVADGGGASETLVTCSSPPCLVLLDLQYAASDWQFRDVQVHERALAGVPVVVLSGNAMWKRRASTSRAMVIRTRVNAGSTSSGRVRALSPLQSGAQVRPAVASRRAPEECMHHLDQPVLDSSGYGLWDFGIVNSSSRESGSVSTRSGHFPVHTGRYFVRELACLAAQDAALAQLRTQS